MPPLHYVLAWFYLVTMVGDAEPIAYGPFVSEAECWQTRAYHMRLWKLPEVGLCQQGWDERGDG